METTTGYPVFTRVCMNEVKLCNFYSKSQHQTRFNSGTEGIRAFLHFTLTFIRRLLNYSSCSRYGVFFVTAL